MNLTERTRLMHAALDGEASPEETRDLERLLAADPALAAAFALRLAEDAEFAKSPAARLEYFHRLHSSWDEQFNLYPVWRVGKTLR